MKYLDRNVSVLHELHTHTAYEFCTWKSSVTFINVYISYNYLQVITQQVINLYIFTICTKFITRRYKLLCSMMTNKEL